MPTLPALLYRAQETLLEAAAYFGPEAVAKCASLTVRKLYQREYHFFSPSGEGEPERAGPCTEAR